MSTKSYDLIVIGSGPAATQCAIDSATRGKKVAIVDDSKRLGGVCVHTGTIPSKTFREAILHFTGYRHQGIYGKSYSTIDKRVTISDILGRVSSVVESEMDAIRSRLKASHVDLIDGRAQFQDAHNILVTKSYTADENEEAGNEKSAAKTVVSPEALHADKFLIACGTKPAHSALVPCDDVRVLDADHILSGSLVDVPRRLIVVGAGVVGIEYASMLNVLPGTTVTVIDTRPEILTFADREIVSSLQYEMGIQGARFLLGEQMESMNVTDNGVTVRLASGKQVSGDALLYTIGRQANTDALNLEAIGITQSKRGLVSVDSEYKTSVDHIYAAGDCIGAPSLASTSLEQGRLASCSMWDEASSLSRISQLDTGNYPYGIYTIPEISMVGKTEQTLTEEGVSYEVGIAKYSELAKGQMLGGKEGFLKILFNPDTLKLYGVHAIGEGATEIIHIGQVAMAMDCTLCYFRDAVFNYPTLAEAYRVAALNGLGRIAP